MCVCVQLAGHSLSEHCNIDDTELDCQLMSRPPVCAVTLGSDPPVQLAVTPDLACGILHRALASDSAQLLGRQLSKMPTPLRRPGAGQSGPLLQGTAGDSLRVHTQSNCVHLQLAWCWLLLSTSVRLTCSATCEQQSLLGC